MDVYDRDAMAVAEAWVPPERAARYVAPDTLHQIFNFDFMACPWDAGRLRDVIEKTMASLTITGAPATWALSNHDSPRVPTRLGGGDEGRRRARALALVAHALPGAVYVYQGEELGLDDVDLPDEVRQDPVFFRTRGEQKGRDAARVPIPWSGDAPPYGFSETTATWLPMPDGWERFTVAAEDADQASTLWQYRAMLRLRHGHPALISEDLVLPEAPPGVLVIERGAGFTCVVNASTSTIESPVSGTILVASDASVMAEDGRISLPPSTGAWIQA
jgi:alpha-glucosidase